MINKNSQGFYLNRKEVIYLLIILFPLLISLPLAVYFSGRSQAPKRGFSVAPVFKDNFEDCQLSLKNWLGHREGWDCQPGEAATSAGQLITSVVSPTEGLLPWPTSLLPSLPPSPTPPGFSQNHLFVYSWDQQFSESSSFAVLNEGNFENLAVEGLIKIKMATQSASLSAGAGLQARVNFGPLEDPYSEIGGYRCLIKKGELVLQRYPLTTSVPQLGYHHQPVELVRTKFTWEIDRWYRMRFELKGGELSCLVSDLENLELVRLLYEDSASLTKEEENRCFIQSGPLFTQGTVGFVADSTTALWDDLTVEVFPEISPLPTVAQTTCTPTPTGLPSATPTLTPTPTPTAAAFLFLRVGFEGFPDFKSEKMSLNLKAKGTDFSRSFVLAEDGFSDIIPLNGLIPGQSYDFLLSSFGYLTAEMSLTLTQGGNPPTDYYDFGILSVGDLNGDDQVNGLDWSLLKMNYGENGEE